MVTFYLDTTETTSKFSEFRIDIEFYNYMKNYLKLFDQKDTFGNPFGYMSSSELSLRLKSLPHSWLLIQKEIRQTINGVEVIVQTKFTEEYINDLRFKFTKLGELAKKYDCLIRWG